MQIFGYEIKKQIKQRSSVQTNYQIFGNTVTYLDANQNIYIKNAFQENPSVYSIIKLISRTAAKAKFLLYKYVNKKKELVEDHDIYTLLNRPNPFLGRAEFIENLLAYKLITGESFIHILSPELGNNAGIPKEMLILPPIFMKIKVNGYGEPAMYVVRNGTHEFPINPEEIIHMKYFNPNPIERPGHGMSPIQAGLKVVKQSNDGYTANMRLIENAGMRGLLSLDDSTVEMKPEQAERLENKLYERQGGAEGYGRFVVAGQKMAWVQMGMNAKDMMLIESQNVSMRDLCNIYGISSQLLNDPLNKTYNNVTEARKAMVINVVMAELESMIEQYNTRLLPPFEKRDNADYELGIDTSVFPEMQDDLLALATIAEKSWWWTPNQRREFTKQGRLEIEGMDSIWIPQGMLPIENALQLTAEQYADYLKPKETD